MSVLSGYVLASSNSKEGLEKLINEFYCSKNYKINDELLLENHLLSKKRMEKINSQVMIVINPLTGRWQFKVK